MHRARHLPSDDPTCGWIQTLPPPPPARRLEGDERADAAVLGAGFVGLAAARRLAEKRPDWRIAVVDAQRAGDGASGRASGFVVDLAGFILAMPKEHGDRFIRLSRAGIGELRRRVEEHGIDCDWDTTGFLHVAAGEAGLASLATLRQRLVERSEPHLFLDRDGMEGVVGSRFYRAGVRLPGSVLVQAASLVRGLAHSLPTNVDLYELSPVTAVERRRGYRLHTAAGSVAAPRLVVALNGYAANLGWLRRHVFPLITFGSLSRPLTADEQAATGGEREWGVLAQDAMGSSVRRTRDQRLLLRNFLAYSRRCRTGDAAYATARELHRTALARRFPHLAGLEFEHTWAGVMGASPNLYPFFGQVGDDLVAAGGYSGAGIAMGTVSGLLLADLLLGETSSLLADRLRLPGPRWIPPEPFLSAGIRFRVARMNAKAGPTL